MAKKARKKQKQPEAAAPDRVERWLRAHALVLSLALIAFGTIRIMSTYDVFNHTSDEMVHIACGMQWLDQGVYKYEPQHPPLARVAAALLPYLAGLRSTGKKWFYAEGGAILYRNQGREYTRNLTLARLGILPFFWVASLVVFWWARRYFGELEAVLAVFLFTFLPPVLAHAGVATTDMALTAFTGAAFLAGRVWLERPTLAYSALFGLSTALAVLSKFSALPFIPMAMAAALLWHLAAERPGFASVWRAARSRVLPFGLAVLTGALVIWAGYRFSISSSGVPAPELFAGVRDVIHHNEIGHITYLLGSTSNSGWWYYYPVLLVFKTPLAFAALLICGVVKCRGRAARVALAFSLGILLFSLTSRINIGVRHILPVYMGFSLVAAAGTAWLLERAAKVRWAAWTAGAMLFWMAATSLASHPDYLPYFNALAGDEPERIAVDSDLDWGQDIKRLGKRLAEVGAREVTFTPFIMADLEHMHGFPKVNSSDPRMPSPGWNAVSLTVLKETRLGLLKTHPEVTPWPEGMKPRERIGGGILLYYFPPR